MVPLGGLTDGGATGVMLTVTAVELSKVPASIRICACGGVSAVYTSAGGKAAALGYVMVAARGAGLPPSVSYGLAMHCPS